MSMRRILVAQRWLLSLNSASPKVSHPFSNRCLQRHRQTRWLSGDKIDKKNADPKDTTHSDEIPVDLKSVYVHPLSQIILLYFQTSCHEWISRRELDHVVMHRDGSFVLTSQDSVLRVWTYYEDRKHWLSAQIGVQDQVRYLLQDNKQPAWNNDKQYSLPERIEMSVRELVAVVDKELE